MWYTTGMNTQPAKVTRALLSVSDKTGIVEFASTLASLGIELLSTGGTAKLLASEGIAVVPVEEYTHVPEMMDGRVKSMHPTITGGILGLRDRHAQDAATHHIPWIDLVVCNLYPFGDTIAKQGISLDEAVEQIDIGGPTMIRSAAKNFGWVTVVVDIADYQEVAKQLTTGALIPFELRKRLATKAFAHTGSYDALIHSYLNEEPFPEELPLAFDLHRPDTIGDELLLRYGENPHQKAAVYRGRTVEGRHDPFSLLDCRTLHGKRLSFNNLGDTYGAIDTLREFSEPACVVVKHASPCGVSVSDNPADALEKAFAADSLSAFGGIISLNRQCDETMATYLSSIFFEVLTAVSYTDKALEILRKKKNLRIIETGPLAPLSNHLVGRFIGNDLLLQEKDNVQVSKDDLKVVTKRTPTASEVEDMLFAWKVVKHVKSNAIVTAAAHTTCGIGGGQVSRVDATKIAIMKSGGPKPMVLASDAFFPFRDNIDALNGSGVTAIIQPGGSIRDKEVIDACDEAGIAMVFTGTRCFLHG
jgi:phosphoribosylaminoimidazolecarboxamide formyltransferase/IMP cyclohydrolase